MNEPGQLASNLKALAGAPHWQSWCQVPLHHEHVHNHDTDHTIGVSGWCIDLIKVFNMIRHEARETFARAWLGISGIVSI